MLDFVWLSYDDCHFQEIFIFTSQHDAMTSLLWHKWELSFFAAWTLTFSLKSAPHVTLSSSKHIASVSHEGGKFWNQERKQMHQQYKQHCFIQVPRSHSRPQCLRYFSRPRLHSQVINEAGQSPITWCAPDEGLCSLLLFILPVITWLAWEGENWYFQGGAFIPGSLLYEKVEDDWIKSLRRPIWAWFQLYLTPEINQTLFRIDPKPSLIDRIPETPRHRAWKWQ